jgi:hypothetical protein
MGENALYGRELIKIGTCENLYWLRFDQRFHVRSVEGSVNPVVHGNEGKLRFRFPFPDEDSVSPGAHQNFDRSADLLDFDLSLEDVEHRKCFDRTGGGAPATDCPQRGVGIVQQKVCEGRLVTVCRCLGCRVVFRLPTIEDAQPLITACREAARAIRSPGVEFWSKVADRIEAGYREGACRGGREEGRA